MTKLWSYVCNDKNNADHNFFHLSMYICCSRGSHQIRDKIRGILILISINLKKVFKKRRFLKEISVQIYHKNLYGLVLKGRKF